MLSHAPTGELSSPKAALIFPFLNCLCGNQLEKTDARNNTFKQLEILKVANENVKQKRNELAPMRTANLQKRTARSALLESKRQLEACLPSSFFFYVWNLSTS